METQCFTYVRRKCDHVPLSLKLVAKATVASLNGVDSGVHDGFLSGGSPMQTRVDERLHRAIEDVLPTIIGSDPVARIAACADVLHRYGSAREEEDDDDDDDVEQRVHS
jgi:hypothetical protein